MLNRYHCFLCAGSWLLCVGAALENEVANFPSTGACVDAHTYTVQHNVTLGRCAEECLRRTRCQAINYYTELQICRLTDSSLLENVTKDGNGCLTADRRTLVAWVRYDIGWCSISFTQCRDTERCDDGDGTHVCRITECPYPESIENAFLLSTLCDVGFKTMYMCKTGFYGRGNAQKTCQPNGKWTESNFECRRVCTLPVLQPNTEIIFKPSGNLVEGSVITLSCQLVTKSVNITCDHDGNWVFGTDTCDTYCLSPFFENVNMTAIPPGPYISGYTVELECLGGFVSWSDPIIATCTDDGHWAVTVGECQRVCPDTFHGMSVVSRSSNDYYRIGDIANVFCSQSVNIFGTMKRIECQEDGTWEYVDDACF